MNFIERDSRNEPSLEESGGRDPNYFAFFDKPTPENLSANRSGILSPQQQDALGVIVANQKHSAIIFGSMSALAILILCFFFWKIYAQDGVISINAPVISAGVAALIFGIFLNFMIVHWESERVIHMVMGYLEPWESDGLRTPELLEWLRRFREDKRSVARDYWNAMYVGIRSAFKDGPDTIPDTLTPGQQAKQQGA